MYYVQHTVMFLDLTNALSNKTIKFLSNKTTATVIHMSLLQIQTQTHVKVAFSGASPIIIKMPDAIQSLP